MIGELYMSRFGRLVYPIFKIFKPTRVTTKNGFTMNIHKGRDYISDSILLKKEWEKSKAKIFYKFIKEGDIVVDIGANIGYYTLIFSRIVGLGKVYAFEPETANFDLLNKNISENKLDNILPYKLALSNKSGVGALKFGEHTHGGGTILEDGRNFGEEAVDVATLDEFFAGKRVDFIKMDVEGGEFNILKGGEETLKKAWGVLTEFMPQDLAKNKTCDPEEFVKLLEESGFELYDVDELTGSFTKFDLKKFKKTWETDKGLYKDILCLKKGVLGSVTTKESS